VEAAARVECLSDDDDAPRARVTTDDDRIGSDGRLTTTTTPQGLRVTTTTPQGLG
jgi:hypothetical protein